MRATARICQPMSSQLFERSRGGENALLIQPHAGGPPADGVLEEFSELARSAGARVLAVLPARIDKPNPSILIGSGKLEEVKAACDAVGADLVLINHALSPIQERNLEKALERRVVDRTGLILDIFAQRARSHEGKLQVELARLQYLSTRLVRRWSHLERQQGGIGGRGGPGETQIELDRRIISDAIKRTKERLTKVKRQRQTQRRQRERRETFSISLVGYTNAGKSTLFNALVKARAYAADQLFATLDTTTRQLYLGDQEGGGRSVSLSDTVGFIRDLPHGLVEAFEATLQVAADADLLLHVVDAANPAWHEQMLEVQRVLSEIGALDVPQLVVFNKLDAMDDAKRPLALQDRMDLDGQLFDRIFASASTGEGLPLLRSELARRAQAAAVAPQDAETNDRRMAFGHNDGLHSPMTNE